MKVRSVRPSDFEDMVETFYSFFPEAKADPSFGLYLFKKRPSMKEERAWFASSMKGIRKGNIVMVVAEVGSRVVGMCEVRRVGPNSPIDHRGTLGICVRKEHRDRGIGKALLEKAIEESKGKFEVVELTVFSQNKRAIALYRRFGFKKFAVRRRAVKRGGRYFDEDLMTLELQRSLAEETPGVEAQ